MNSLNNELPVRAVDHPILCNPYDEPNDHWMYGRETGAASRAGHRRPAGYWYKTDKVGAAQQRLFFEEERDDLTLVNLLRADVRRWREAEYRGASHVTKDLLRHWARPDLSRRLFFCQREAVETIIYLAEMRIAGKTSRTGFKNFELSDADLRRLLSGERPSFASETVDYIQTLIDRPVDASLLPLRRLGCKMATGSGKTVVMGMLIAWAFCNRGVNRQSREYPHGVLICCPNLTVKDRLQVLRPDRADNYFEQFDIVPEKYRPLLQTGRVLITNWHRFALESEHKEGDRTYAAVNKGPETPDAFARRALGDLYERLPIMVLNDEGHHCWRPAPGEEEVDRDERKHLEEEKEEARVWLEGLDRINNCMRDRQPGVSYCVDLSATPFYLKGSGYPEGRPFPWLVSDFGLVDAIESGIVKIPRLPVQDTTGRPDPRYFKLWEAIRENLQPGEKLPGRSGKPKPEVVYREAEGALLQIAGQWVERFNYMQEATPGKEHVPPVLIVVCDNMDIAEVFYRKISGQREEEIVTEDDVVDAAADDDDGKPGARSKRKKKPKTRTVYEPGAVYPEFFSNTQTQQRTIRFDSSTLDEAEELRRIVSTVGKPGEPGEHIRCVVAVMMLNEGWDANNVTHILGIRAFKSQLLCEQVVGRGLRRMDYKPDPGTGMLTAEYVDVYGIPFSVIPFKGRPSKSKTPEDKPKNHVRALPERSRMEIRFPVVEGYVFALERNLVRCDVDEMEPLVLEPNREPTATFVLPTIGYYEGHAAQRSAPWEFVEQNREEYYRQQHVQAIQFEIARIVVEQLNGHEAAVNGAKRRVMRLQSRHQLFPQVYGFVEEYVRRRVDFQTCNACELGLRKYVERIIERLRDAIEPDDAEGEPPLMPVLNRYKPVGTSGEVDFKTTQPCRATRKSHVNQITSDTQSWEQSAAFKLEQCRAVECYIRNDHLGFVIPFEYHGVEHGYEPDFIVRLTDGLNVVLEIKGYEDDQTRAKHGAARRWVSAVNHWGREGRWAFHVCRNPQTLEHELSSRLQSAPAVART
jgi:type III restriction enzyme